MWQFMVAYEKYFSKNYRKKEYFNSSSKKSVKITRKLGKMFMVIKSEWWLYEAVTLYSTSSSLEKKKKPMRKHFVKWLGLSIKNCSKKTI